MRAGSQRLMAGSPARAPMPGNGCFWRRCCAAARVCAGRAPGEGACRRPRKGTAWPNSGHSSDGQLQGRGAYFIRLLPHVRRAGPPCIGNKECGVSARSRIDFCRSVCLSCHVPDSACLDACMKCLDASCVSIRGSPGEFRISSRSSRRCAGDAPPARERARTGSRAYLYVPYAGRSRQ